MSCLGNRYDPVLLVLPDELVGERILIVIGLLVLKWSFRVDPATIEERKEKMLNYERQRIHDADRRMQSRELMRFQESSEIVS